MTRFTLLLLGVLLASPAYAQGTVFKCVDDRGRVTYTNDRTQARNCQSMRTDQPVSSVAPVTPATPAAKPSGSNTPNSFPNVSQEQQRSRDNDRRAILESELKSEETSLQSAQAALKAQEDLYPPEERNAPPRNAEGKVTGAASINAAKRNARLEPYIGQVELHQRNVEALKREMSRLR